MAMQFPQSGTTTGATINLGTTDSVFVASSVFLASTGGQAIIGFGSNHQVIIEGIVASDNATTVSLGDSLDSGQSVEISASGEVRQFGAANTLAVVTFGADSNVNNDGLVTSAVTGILMSGDAAVLTNSGTVQAHGSAVRFATNTSISVLNNSGSIEGGTAAFSGSDGTDKIINSGTMVGDIFFNAGDDIYQGGKGSHDGTLFGGDGNDRITGGGGNDHFQGGANNDILKGGKGNDTLKGDDGNDKLVGGKGNDKLIGGGDADRFVFARKQGNDKIQDFENGSDKIDLKAFNFNSKAQALSHFFEIGSGSNNKLGFEHQGTNILVKGIDMGDLNGADILI